MSRIHRLLNDMKSNLQDEKKYIALFIQLTELVVGEYKETEFRNAETPSPETISDLLEKLSRKGTSQSKVSPRSKILQNIQRNENKPDVYYNLLDSLINMEENFLHDDN